MATGTLDLDLGDPGTALTTGRMTEEPFDRRQALREAGGGRARFRPDEPVALRGCVLTPDEALEDHCVVVAGDHVQEITAAAPDGMTVIESAGVVLPGLIDLPGPPKDKVFSAGEPPQQYPNGYAWGRSAEYDAVVRKPWAR